MNLSISRIKYIKKHIYESILNNIFKWINNINKNDNNLYYYKFDHVFINLSYNNKKKCIKYIIGKLNNLMFIFNNQLLEHFNKLDYKNYFTFAYYNNKLCSTYLINNIEYIYFNLFKI